MGVINIKQEQQFLRDYAGKLDLKLSEFERIELLCYKLYYNLKWGLFSLSSNI